MPHYCEANPSDKYSPTEEGFSSSSTLPALTALPQRPQILSPLGHISSTSNLNGNQSITDAQGASLDQNVSSIVTQQVNLVVVEAEIGGQQVSSASMTEGFPSPLDLQAAQPRSSVFWRRMALTTQCLSLILIATIIPLASTSKSDAYLTGTYTGQVETYGFTFPINANVKFYLNSVIATDASSEIVLYQEDPLSPESSVFKSYPKAYRQLKSARAAIVATIVLSAIGLFVSVISTAMSVIDVMQRQRLTAQSSPPKHEGLPIGDAEMAAAPQGEVNPRIINAENNLPPVTQPSTAVHGSSQMSVSSSRLQLAVNSLGALSSLCVSISITVACSLLVDLYEHRGDMQSDGEDSSSRGGSGGIDFSKGVFDLRFATGPVLLFVAWGLAYLFLMARLCSLWLTISKW